MVLPLFLQGFLMAFGWLRKKSKGGDKKFTKGTPSKEGKEARDAFFAARKGKAHEPPDRKKLTPLQRRMLSGRA